MSASLSIGLLKSYPAYKPSGVEWLEEVPTHWESVRLKGHASNVVDLTRESSADDIYLALEHVESWTGRFAPAGNGVGFDSQVKRFRSGDVLFGKLRPYLAKVTCPNNSGVCVGEFLVLRPSAATLSARYLEKLLRSQPAIDAIDASTFGAKMPRADWQFIGDMRVPLPPLAAQRAIVRYLDYVDRRIRRYVNAKRKLISLLEEERQVVINHAVTRGLDPNVRLKPSGAEWLGDVPEHWDVLRVGRFSKIGNGSTPSRGNAAYWTDGVHPWLNSSSVNQGVITRADQFVTDLALRECHLPRLHPGSVLVGITGQGKTRGMAAVLSIDATINQHMAFITPDMTRVSSHYLQMCLTAAYSELRAISDDSGSTKGALTCEDIKRFKVVLPPREEQDRLVSEVRREFAGVDATIGRTRRQIELVQEYRTRLIADVVTGKLDVREAAEYLPDEAEDDTPIGESDPQQNGLAEVFHVAEEEIAIAEEVTI